MSDLAAAVAAGVFGAEEEHRKLLQATVEVAWLGGGTLKATGNSFATPHVAGLCAAICTERGCMTLAPRFAIV